MLLVLRRRRSTRARSLVLVFLVLLINAGPRPAVFAQAPTPTPTPLPSPSPTPAPTPTATPGPTPTATPTPAPRVLAIEVFGNKEIATERIAAVITIKVGEIFDPERLRRDVEAILGLGWFADVTVRLESEPGGVRLVFLIVENPVITEVVVRGNTVISAEEIIRALSIPIGQVLNARAAREGVRAVERLYESRGYVLARITDLAVEPSGDGRLIVRVAEGRVEDIVFRGLTKTRLSVATRYLRIKRGEVFNVAAMNADLQRLFDTGLFETIQARPRPGSTPDTVVIEIEVKEAQTGRISFGVGYSSSEGVLGQIEYGERNWRGTAQSISLRVERGLTSGTAGQATKTNFQVTFREPYLDDRPTALDIGLFQLASIQTEVIGGAAASRFTLDRVGSFIELDRPLDPFTTISLRLRSEVATITALPLDPASSTCPCPLPSLYSPGRTISLLVGAARDTRDSRLNPTRGSRQALSLEWGVPILGGEFSFQKYFAEYIHYIPVGQGHIAGRVQVGLGNGFIPFQEWYVLGGSTTLRGFQTGQFRGTSMALLNVEYRTPLSGIAPFLRDFLGIAFVDVGTAPIGGSAGVKTSFGIGTAFNSPLGLIRVDVAFGGPGIQTWLTLGQPF